MPFPRTMTMAAISGGTMEPPGPAAAAGRHRRRQVDVVVVYKVDRLTRSLVDFAKIVEAFDAQRRLLRLRHPAVQHHDLAWGG